MMGLLCLFIEFLLMMSKENDCLNIYTLVSYRIIWNIEGN